MDFIELETMRWTEQKETEKKKPEEENGEIVIAFV